VIDPAGQKRRAGGSAIRSAGKMRATALPAAAGTGETIMAGEAELAAAEVQRGLQEFYRSGAAGRRRVGAVTLLGSGFETEIFAFSLAGSRAGEGDAQELILRLYAGEGAPGKAAHEFAAMRRLRQAGYPVPRVRALDAAGAPLGRPMLIMERIQGVSLGPSYWSGDAGQRREAESLLYRLMADLHALEGRRILPDSPLAGARDPYAFLDHELAFLAALLTRLDGREPPSLRTALDWLVSHRPGFPCERLAVVHGDFHPNNVLLQADGTPIVIDWSNARLGDPRADLAWTRLITRAADSPGGGAAALRRYGERAGTPVTGIEYFEAAACVRLLLSVLISLQFGAARQGMRPEAEALMRRDADHMLYVAALLQARTGTKMPDLEDALAGLLGKGSA
jgi:aminoglycoside phosphotransferase (APT) family kinase protein